MPANGAERVVGDDVSYEAVARPTSMTDTGQLRSGSRTGRAAVEPWMRVRQIAWIRMSNGGWLAVVLVPASSANRRCRVTLQLWLEPDAFTTDLSAGK
jgi:hypothetical protein